MLKRRQGVFAAIVVTALTSGLVVLDLIDGRFRRWWAGRALTTDTVSGMLVVLVTVLVVDQVVTIRQVNDRSRATAAQAAIVMAQAARASEAVSSAITTSGERTAASEELRTYMTMLLIAAPILIEAQIPRRFLERAQHLAAELARALAALSGGTAVTTGRLDEAVEQLRGASAPLLKVLDPQQRLAAGGPDSPLSFLGQPDDAGA